MLTTYPFYTNYLFLLVKKLTRGPRSSSKRFSVGSPSFSCFRYRTVVGDRLCRFGEPSTCRSETVRHENSAKRFCNLFSGQAFSILSPSFPHVCETHQNHHHHHQNIDHQHHIDHPIRLSRSPSHLMGRRRSEVIISFNLTSSSSSLPPPIV